MPDKLDVEVLPILKLPGGELDGDGCGLGEEVVAGGQEGVALQVHLFDLAVGGQLAHIHVDNIVVAGIEHPEISEPENNRWDPQERVSADVQFLETLALQHLFRKPRHLVVGQVQHCEGVELGGELGVDFGEFVGGEVDGEETGVAEQVVDGVRHLHQLAGAQVEVATLHGLVASRHHPDHCLPHHPGVHDLRVAQDHVAQGRLELGLHPGGLFDAFYPYICITFLIKGFQERL